MASGTQESGIKEKSRVAISVRRPRGRVGPVGSGSQESCAEPRIFLKLACDFFNGSVCRKDGAENSGILFVGPGPNLNQNLVQNPLPLLNRAPSFK